MIAGEGDFNPMSPNAMFATILTRLDNQDDAIEAHHEENKDVLGKILVQAKLTNGRVTQNETDIQRIQSERIQFRKYLLGWAAGASFVGGSVWAVVSKFL